MPNFSRLLTTAARALASGLDALVTKTRASWRHHRELMDENSSYRAQIYLGVTTILTALQIHPTLTVVAGVLLALYVAAHDDGRWQPPSRGLRSPDWPSSDW